MTMTERDKRALRLLAGAALIGGIVWFWPSADESVAGVVPGTATPQQLEQQILRLRRKQSELPVKEGLAKDLAAQVAAREKGLIQAETLAQAQAQLADVVRQTGRQQGIEFRAVSMTPPSTFEGLYGQVAVQAVGDCKVEQVVNFLAELTKRPELLSTSYIRIGSANPKEKSLMFQVTVTGLVPKALVPEKKS
jgi:hypothetical protein